MSQQVLSDVPRKKSFSAEPPRTSCWVEISFLLRSGLQDLISNPCQIAKILLHTNYFHNVYDDLKTRCSRSYLDPRTASSFIHCQ